MLINSARILIIVIAVIMVVIIMVTIAKEAPPSPAATWHDFHFGGWKSDGKGQAKCFDRISG